MNLTEALADLEPSRGGTECLTCWLFRDAPEDDRSAVNRAIDSGAPMTRIAARIRSNGYDVTVDSLLRHKKNGHRL